VNQLEKNRNPAKGRGERYIYCPIDGECVDRAAKLRWQSFNCEKCEIYLASETCRESKKKANRDNDQTKTGGNYMSDDRNQLVDLNDSLFRQMNRLTDEKLDEKGLQNEILRSKAVSNLAAQIIQNSRLALDGAKAIKAGLTDQGTLMLGRGKNVE
jgi:hypothetical protein